VFDHDFLAVLYVSSCTQFLVDPTHPGTSTVVADAPLPPVLYTEVAVLVPRPLIPPADETNLGWRALQERSNLRGALHHVVGVDTENPVTRRLSERVLPTKTLSSGISDRHGMLQR
jgi:hypothetical protein